MNKSWIAMLLVALVGGVAGGLVGRMAGDTPSAPARSERPRDNEAGLKQWFEERLQRHEERAHRRSERVRPEPSPASARTQPADVPDSTGDASGLPQPETKVPDDILEGILGKRFGGAESTQLFHRLSIKKGQIDPTIDRLKKLIEGDPNNPELYAALGSAFTAKTVYGVTPGPEQGVVWALAEKAYDEAIRLQPTHWLARYSKAFGNSMAPEFVGLRPKAIREFEALMKIQETGAPDPEQVMVYSRLGTLYKDAGNVKKAREIWERGLVRFPNSKPLREVLAIAGDEDG